MSHRLKDLSITTKATLLFSITAICFLLFLSATTYWFAPVSSPNRGMIPTSSLPSVLLLSVLT